MHKSSQTLPHPTSHNSLPGGLVLRQHQAMLLRTALVAVAAAAGGSGPLPPHMDVVPIVAKRGQRATGRKDGGKGIRRGGVEQLQAGLRALLRLQQEMGRG